jgi:stage V sporulation protein AA
MDIYIKPVKKTILAGRPEILIGDLAGVVAAGDMTGRIRELRLAQIDPNERKKNILIKCTDIIKAITNAFPDARVFNVGEKDTVVMYSAKQKKTGSLLLWTKVALVTLVLFVGAATAVMSFHTDAQIPKVFENYYKIFYGEEKENPPLLTIPYSLGIAVGIVLFYNHALGKKLSDDPTPLEVEMSNYENEVTDTMRDMLSKSDANS